MSNRYGIDSYHVAVGAGDAAIHLLLLYGDMRKFPYGQILRAILVDGGDKDRLNFILSNVQETMAIIRKKYRLGTKPLQFDAIVVTHWDKDHYNGIIELIKADIEEQLNKVPAPSMDQLQISFMKYTGTGRSNPGTVMYAPYWNPPKPLKKRKYSGPPKVFQRSNGKLDFVPEKKKKGKGKVTVRYIGICLLNTDDFRGTNFLENKPLLPKELINNGTITSPQVLFQRNPPTGDTNMPGIYCVATNQRTFPPGNLGVIDKDGTTPVNLASVFAMVIWGDGHLSHYFAGDADYTVETQVANWSKAKGNREVAGGTVTTVKLSHHGGKMSSPTIMLDKYFPQNVIVSSGKGHGHPTWEILCYLDALYLASDAADQGKHIYCTHYPGYLARRQKKTGELVFDELKNVALDVFQDKTPKWANFAAALQAKWDKINKANAGTSRGGSSEASILQSYTDYITATKPGPQTANRKRWVCGKIEESWPRWSATDADQLAAASVGWKGPNMQPNHGKKYLRYFMVQSRKRGAAEDGKVWLRYRDSQVDVQPRAVIKKSGKRLLDTNDRGSLLEREVGGRVLKKRMIETGQGIAIVNSKFSGGGDPDPAEEDDEDMEDSGGKEMEDEGDEEESMMLGTGEGSTISTILTREEIPISSTTGAGGTYYLYGTDIQDKVPSGEVILSGETDSELDDFVNLLHRCCIGLVSDPIANSGISTTSFGEKDEWYCWLQDSIQVTRLEVATGPDGVGAIHITGFNIEMTSPKDTILPSPPAIPSPPLLFSTGFAADALGLPAFRTQIPGYVSQAGIMAFGLSITEDMTMALPDVFLYVGITEIGTLIEPLQGVNLVLRSGNSAGQRNAVWFNPGKNYETTIRLQFELDDDKSGDGNLDRVNNFLHQAMEDITLESVKVIAKRTSKWLLSYEGPTVQSEGEVVLRAVWKFRSIAFDITIDFHGSSLMIMVTEQVIGDNGPDAFTALVGWLNEKCKESFDVQTWLESIDSGRNIRFRRLTLTINMDDDGKPSFAAFSMDIEVGFHLGNGSAGGSPVVFLISLGWSSGGEGTGGFEVTGALWCVGPPTSNILEFLPAYEPYLLFTPVTPGPLSETLDLATLFGTKVENVSNIPFTPEISQASISLTSTTISFRGTMICPPPPPSDIPTLHLGDLSLSASYNYKSGETNLSCDVIVLLEPAADSKYQTPALLSGSVDYDGADKKWTLTASVQDLYLSALVSFFDNKALDAGVMSYIEHLEIQYLGLVYNYQEGANTFTFTGNILLGELQLGLTYTYEETGWSFTGTLMADVTGESTVGAVVESIIGGTSSDLPSFVASIPITHNDGIFFSCGSKKSSDEASGALIFTGTITISGFQLTFIQYRKDKKTWAADVPSKRLIKVAITRLPQVDFPVVGNLEQPFDEMYYMWVQDNSKQNTKGPGLLEGEIGEINDELENLPSGTVDKLLYKKVANEMDAERVLIAAGSHFVLVLKQNDEGKEIDGQGNRVVVLDYVFGQPTSTKIGNVPNIDLIDSFAEGGDGGDDDGESGGGEPSPASMASYKRSIGPLSITNIGFQIKGNTLKILFDATFALGPLSFELLGFGVGLEFKQGFNLHHLPSVEPSLSGLSVSFDRPPISISGIFEHDVSQGADIYAGGIIVAFTPYLFEAAGFYGTISLGDEGANKITAFIFALLAGPLVELEFAEISGITGGFGYNSAVRYPSVNEVLSFPFITIKAAPANPLEALRNLVNGPDPWFTPQNDSFWVAAGLKVTAFETLVVDAVVIVEWNPSVSLGIFGIAAADIPADPNIEEKFARIELGIAATVDFNAGVMKFEAQLTPNSYILSPDCHLTGGFALYYWFEGADPSLQGDWVFTIGGFHSAFQRPPQYPNPPRLAISWNLDDSLSITGQAYFAITPKVCMGGGLLHASLSLGPLEAFFDAYADFLINYKPFHFIADAGVSVGVRFTLDLWICTIHISVEISAQLFLEGPPLSGIVHVDFWVFGFDIHFGPDPYAVGPVSLTEFYKLVYQASLTSSPSSVSTLAAITSEGETAEPSKDNAHIFSCQSGQIPGTANGSTSTPEGGNWVVRGGLLSFGIACRMAIDKADVNVKIVGEEQIPEVTASPTSPVNSIYAKPMQLTKGQPLTSGMTVTITPGTHSVEPYKWRATPIMKAVPSALWGPYNHDQDPSNPNANVSTLLNGGDPAINLMMGVIISTPYPTASNDVISPFKAVLEDHASVFPHEEEKHFPPITEQSSDWLPLPSTGGPDQWDKIKDAWEAPAMGVGSAQTMVDAWKELFSWENAALPGAAPTMLLAGFGDYYLEAPLLGVLDHEKKAGVPIAV